METANISGGMRYYLMAVTPTRLYSFTGIGSLDVSEVLFIFFLLLFSELDDFPKNDLVKFVYHARIL